VELSTHEHVLEARTSNMRREDMQTTTSMTPKGAAPQTIPADVLARLENEWRQVRQPSSQPASK
jgi:hypothetical protein